MIAAPVVHKNYGIAAHSWGMTTAAAYVVDRVWRVNCSSLNGYFWDKPNTSFAPHAI